MKRSEELKKQVEQAQAELQKGRRFIEQKTQEIIQLSGRLLEAEENEKPEVVAKPKKRK